MSVGYAQVIKAWLSYLYYAQSNQVVLNIKNDTNFVSLPLSLKNNTLCIERAARDKICQNLVKQYGVSSYSDLQSVLHSEGLLIGWTFPTFWSSTRIISSVGSTCYPLYFLDVTNHLLSNSGDVIIDLSTVGFHVVSEHFVKYLGYSFEEVERALVSVDGVGFNFVLSRLLNEISTNFEEISGKFVEDVTKRANLLTVDLNGSLFQLKFDKFSHGLKKELQWFYSKLLNNDLYIRKGSAADIYLSTSAEGYLGSSASYGTNLKHAPEDDQLAVMQLAPYSSSLTVSGPPGCGKTFLIRGLLSGVVCSRALRIAHNDIDVSNFTLVTSSVHRAIENAISTTDTIDSGTFVDGSVFFDLTGDSLLREIHRMTKLLDESDFDQDVFDQTRLELLNLCSDIADNTSLYEDIVENEDIDIALRDLSYTMRKAEKELEDLLEKKKKFENIIPIEYGIEELVYEDYEVLHSYLEKLGTGFLSSIFDRIYTYFFYKHNSDRLVRGSNAFGISEKDVASICGELATVRNKLRQRDRLSTEVSVKESTYQKHRASYAQLFRKKKEKIENIDTNVLDLFKRIPKKDNLSVHHQIYRTSRKLMFLYALKHKEEVLNALNIFVELFGSFNDDKIVSQSTELFIQNYKEYCRWFSVCFPFACIVLDNVPVVFPFKIPELFNMAIIDEAGYVQCHTAFPAVYRSSRVVYTGDLRQLKPKDELSAQYLVEVKKRIFPNEEFYRSFSPSVSTALHRASRSTSNDIKCDVSLNVTRRNHPEIVDLYRDFGNYNLVSAASETFDMMSLVQKLGGRIFYSNVSEVPRDRSWTMNSNEVQVVSKIVEKLLRLGANKDEIVVLTVYDTQAALLSRWLSKTLSWKNIGTIYKFQGKESNIVIFSSVHWNVTHRANFIVEPNILNTTISRAKSVFIGVSNFERMTESSGWAKLYVEKLTSLGKNFEFD